MTNEERNIKLKHLITCMKCEVSGKECDVNCSTQYEAGNMGEIIENLEAISEIIEQEQCDDCISREYAEGIFKEARRQLKPQDYKTAYEFNTRDLMLLNAEQLIHQLPSVTPKEKTAEWYDEDGCNGACEGYMSAGVICSQCGEVFCGYIGDYDFCPNCGAKMIDVPDINVGKLSKIQTVSESEDKE